MEWAVEVEDMTVAYTTKPVLWDVDMKVPIGSLAAIVGPNGAGKSTLLKAMLGLLTVISGSVKFYIDHHLAMDKKDYKKIAYVPQSGSVDWDFPTTVLDVVLMGRYGHLGLSLIHIYRHIEDDNTRFFSGKLIRLCHRCYRSYIVSIKCSFNSTAHLRK